MTRWVNFSMVRRPVFSPPPQKNTTGNALEIVHLCNEAWVSRVCLKNFTNMANGTEIPIPVCGRSCHSGSRRPEAQGWSSEGSHSQGFASGFNIQPPLEEKQLTGQKNNPAGTVKNTSKNMKKKWNFRQQGKTPWPTYLGKKSNKKNKFLHKILLFCGPSGCMNKNYLPTLRKWVNQYIDKRYLNVATAISTKITGGTKKRIRKNVPAFAVNVSITRKSHSRKKTPEQK